MATALIVLAVILVLAIATVVVGREARRLDAVAPRTAYVLDDAVVYVADHLSSASQARLTHDEVRSLVLLHLDRLSGKGLTPDDVVDRRQDLEIPLFVDETDEIGYLLGRATAADLSVEDQDVAAVLAAHLGYLDAVGAIGPRVELT
jgi:hypothetical protein